MSAPLSSVTPFTPQNRDGLGRGLKPSLKSMSNYSDSTSSASSASSSFKNVRFAAELTTVKNFDSAAEPISISTENSPKLEPIDFTSNAEDSDSHGEDGGLWFNNFTLLPGLFRNKNRVGGKNKKDFSLSRFQLDYDSDSGLEDDEFEEEEYDFDQYKNQIPSKDKGHQFEVIDWKFLESNVTPFNYQNVNNLTEKEDKIQLEQQLFHYLQGSNIRLHSLEQVRHEFGKISGLIYVNNLNFEKFIEIKLTFNNWRDVHYVTATYHRSITNRVDEFQFVIDLNILNYSLRVRNLLYCNPCLKNTPCPLNVEFCCRYDVNGETFYDNNNYENYQMKLVGITETDQETKDERAGMNHHETKNEIDELNMTKGNIFARDFLVTTTLSHSHKPFSSAAKPSEVRRFSEDTDYYNTSPLRHLYHNDTSLIRPAKKNEILINPIYDNNNDDNADTDVPSPTETEEPLDIVRSGNMDIPDSRSVSDSTSAYSSPSDDMNLMDNTFYYRYPSANSLSSLELNSDLTMNHYNYTSTDVGMTLGNLADEDTFDDIQSIVTDTIGDVYYNHDSAPRNNSVETLLTPGAMHRLVSSNSGSPSTSNNNIASNGSNEAVTRSKMSGPTKDMDYQTFLNSYCFCNHPHNEVLEKNYDGAGSSPTIQAI